MPKMDSVPIFWAAVIPHLIWGGLQDHQAGACTDLQGELDRLQGAMRNAHPVYTLNYRAAKVRLRNLKVVLDLVG